MDIIDLNIFPPEVHPAETIDEVEEDEVKLVATPANKRKQVVATFIPENICWMIPGDAE